MKHALITAASLALIAAPAFAQQRPATTYDFKLTAQDVAVIKTVLMKQTAVPGETWTPTFASIAAQEQALAQKEQAEAKAAADKAPKK